VNDKIEIVWMTCKPAPDAILELMCCKCKRTCGSTCICKQNGLPCSALCHKFNCDNAPSESDDIEQVVLDDEESDSE